MNEQDLPVEVLETEKLVDCRVFEVVRESLRVPDGPQFERFTVVHPGAAVLIPIRDDGQLMLTKQYRHSVRDHLFEFPAGTLEKGEAPLECAKREIVEEIGYAASDWIELGQLYPAPGFCNEVQHGFVAKALTPEEANPDEDEMIEVVSLSVKQVETAIQEGEMIDGKSIAFFFKARLHGLV